MNNLFDNADKEKARKEKIIHQGGTESGSFIAGVRLIQPLDSYGKRIGIGYNYEAPEGTVTIYDGTLKYIDKSVFESDVEQYEARQRRVDYLAKSFLKTGDHLCFKYLNNYYYWLLPKQPEGDDFNLFVEFLMTDGFTRDRAEQIALDLQQYDGTPDNINSFTNSSDAYVKSLNKLLRILAYVSVIFVGEKPIATPYAQGGNDIPITNPNNDGGATVSDVTKNRKQWTVGTLGKEKGGLSSTVSGTSEGARPTTYTSSASLPTPPVIATVASASGSSP